MTIDIHDYLDEKRIAEIVEEEFRNALRENLRKKHIQGFLVNVSYETALHLICEEFEISRKDFEVLITRRIREILRDPKTLRFEVFRRDYFSGDKLSPAVVYLDEVLSESKPKIEAAVNKIIEKYPFMELRENLNDVIYDCIMRKLNT